MAVAGLATDSITGNTLQIVYDTTGTDTITVIAANAYGSDTATTTLTVLGCAAVDSLPWAPQLRYYNSNLTCWQFLNYSYWNNSRWSMNNYDQLRSYAAATGDTANNWLITPAIDLPVTLDGSTLRWTTQTHSQTIDHVVYHPYMDVLLTTGDATDTSTYTHVLFADYLYTESQRMYETSLDSFAGQTVHIAFVHRGTSGGYIQLDAVSIENGGSPEVVVTPPTALNVGDSCRFTAHIASGAHNGLTYTWHSTLAGITLPGSSFVIVYPAAGIDTITCIAANAFGSDTAIVIMSVHDCPPISLPWFEDFEDSTSAECWSTFAYHYNNYLEYERISSSWQLTVDSANHRMEVTSVAYEYLITPAIALPAVTDDTNIVLVWEQSSNYSTPIYVVVSPTGLYNGKENFTDTLGRFYTTGTHFVLLSDYGGSTVRVAFIASYAYASALTLDNVAISLERDTTQTHDTVWRTVRVTSDLEYCTVDGGGVYADSSWVAISATPVTPQGADFQIEFDHWNDGDTSNPRDIFVVSDTAFTAYFREVQDSVGIADVENSRLEVDISPNPSDGDVTISVGQASTLTVVDIAGHIVIPAVAVDSTFRIARRSLSPGSYFVRIAAAGGVAVRKLVIAGGR